MRYSEKIFNNKDEFIKGIVDGIDYRIKIKYIGCKETEWTIVKKISVNDKYLFINDEKFIIDLIELVIIGGEYYGYEEKTYRLNPTCLKDLFSNKAINLLKKENKIQ